MKNSNRRKIEVVNEGCEDEMQIFGYRRSRPREFACNVFTFLTLGVLKLVFDWYPVVMVRLRCSRSSLEQADFVQLIDQYKQTFVAGVLSMIDDEGRKYFLNKKVKYIWNREDKIFEKLRGPHHGQSCSYFHRCQGLTTSEQEKRREIFGSNSVRVHVTPILKLLYTQGLNPFYMFQVFSCSLWFVDQYYYFAACIIIMSVLSLAAQIHQMRQSERKLKHTVGGSAGVSVYRRDTGEFESVPAEDLVPGDLVEIPRAGCIMQCDAVLTSGICIVNESMLTGESIPVTKISVPHPCLGADEPFKEKDHSRHILYCGTKVIQTRFYDNQRVTAVVMHTGFMTAKGELVRSILFPKPVNFKFTRDSYKFLACLALVAGIGMVYTVVLMATRRETLKRILVRTLDLVTIVIPPALPAAMTVGVVMAQKRLWDSLIYCLDSNNINLCGAVDVFCFDKTGTLTEDGLDLKAVVPVGKSGGFESELSDVKRLGSRDKVVVAMATCHSLTTIDDEIVGDPVDLKMFEATDWVFDEDESKFDTFVPTVVKPRNQKPGVEAADDYGILRQFTFSSKLQRMSVVTRGLNSPHFELFCKGAPEMVASLSDPETVPENFQEVLMNYTRKGYRVLALAHRVLKMGLIKVQRCQREQAEKKMTMLGLLIFENQLKSQTKTTIDVLKAANIRSIMVTGDNLLTALSVAKNCGMIDQRDRIAFVTSLPSGRPEGPGEGRFELHWAKVDDYDGDDNERRREENGLLPTDCVKISIKDDFVALPMEAELSKLHLAVTGKSWALIRKNHPSIMDKLLEHGAVFARFSPDQKQQLIESLIEKGHFVGMCGDGANDCGALKAAHAGISLSEAEASVASPFTSKQANISCVPNLIREGRAALVTSFGTFKFMASYSLTQFISVCLLYWVGANLTDLQFLYIDMMLLAPLSFTFTRTHAFPSLDPRPPRVSLLALPPILSILQQVAINLLFQLSTWFLVVEQPWFESYSAPPAHMRNFSCHEVTAVFSVSAFQYITLAIVYSKGAPYRKTLFTNYLFMLNIFISSAVTALVVASPVPVQWFFDIFQLRPPPNMVFRFQLLALALLNFFVSFVCEMFFIDLWLDKNSKTSSPGLKSSDRRGNPCCWNPTDRVSVIGKEIQNGSAVASVQLRPAESSCGQSPEPDWLPHHNEHQSLAELMDAEQTLWDRMESSVPRTRALSGRERDLSDDDDGEDDRSRKSSASASLIGGRGDGRAESEEGYVSIEMEG